jgi:signal transduction histidine kinase
LRLYDLSIRHKLPLWGGGLIVATACLVAIPFLIEAHDEVRRDMLFDSEALGLTLVEALNADLATRDAEHAQKIIRAPFVAQNDTSYFKFEAILAIDPGGRVFASSQPDRYPVASDVRAYSDQFARVWRGRPSAGSLTRFDSDGDKALVAIPIRQDGSEVGTLLLVHAPDFHFARFGDLALRTALFTLLALLLLLPVSWYWGVRMARPLTLLAERMDAGEGSLPAPLPPQAYPYRDELGRLFRQFDRLAAELQEKERLRQAVMESEHLATLGRMAAGIAHEINNPLGGLLTAIDTMKQHGSHDRVTDRVVPLLERGLNQIRDTVSAMLVEARPGRLRHLNRQDIDDVVTIVRQGARKAGAGIDMRNDLAGELALPASLVRQVLLNLLLNACRAAERGTVKASVSRTADRVAIVVENPGPAIPDEIRQRLFEPFVGSGPDSRGLGLWVTHHIVVQLAGEIAAESRDGLTRFTVSLPVGECACPAA